MGCGMTRPPHFLVLQHLDCEHPGYIKKLMRERDITWDTTDFSITSSMPELKGYDAMLVFGGPMNVDEVDAYPWLTGEVELIRQAHECNFPVLGLCLGAQLLAKALGARVYAAPVSEVGVMSVTMSRSGIADPLFAGLMPTFTVFQWHGDTFELPEGATLLASSDACPNQAFRHGSSYGLQFHLEITEEMAAAWAAIPAYIASAQQSRGPAALAVLDAELTSGLSRFHATCTRVFANFLKTVVAQRERVS